jgi:F-type H+-transporting ATPase subunit delta
MAKLKESYVNALLERSEESGTLERDLEQASLVRDELKGEDVQKFLVHPNVSNTVKHKLFQDAFSDKISIHLMEFLDLMIRKNQESLFLLVLTENI